MSGPALFLLPVGLGFLLGLLFSGLPVLLLFHPRRELRILGRRLPLTPGLFLRRRDRIAAFAAQLFDRELMSGTLLAERLADPAVKADLEKAIHASLELALKRPAGEVFAGIGLAGASGGDPLLGSLAGRAWGRLSGSPEFSAAMAAALGQALVLVEDLPLRLLLPAAGARSVATTLLSSANLDRFESAARSWLAKVYGTTGRAIAVTSLGFERPSEAPGEAAGYLIGLIPAASLEPLVSLFVDGLYAAAVPVIEKFLNDGDTRRLVESSALEIVRRAIARLNVLQRLIVGAANYERSIAETMPETVEDLVSMVSGILRSASMRERTRAAALEAWREGFSGVAADLNSALAGFVSRQAAERALSSTLDLLRERGPLVVERAVALVASRPDASLGKLLSLLGITGGSIAKAGDPAKGSAFGLELGSLLGGGSEAGKALATSIETFAATFLANLAPLPLGRLVGDDPRFLGELSSWISMKSLEAVSAESARIIEGLEIRKALIDKIQGIDMLEAEGLLRTALGRGRFLLPLGLSILGGLVGLANALVFSWMATR